MVGVNSSIDIIGNSFTGFWVVPEIPVSCLGRTVSPTSARLWDGQPDSGTSVSGVATSVSGSVNFLLEAIAIKNCIDLQKMNEDLNADYFLLNDIDCSDTVNWNSGKGFDPISFQYTPFTGTFYGNGFIISNLYINRIHITKGIYIGLFGYIKDAKIYNTSLIDINITCFKHCGGLVGHMAGSSEISNSYSTGTIIGNNGAIGGLVGSIHDFGKVFSSYSTVTVIDNGDYISDGGLIGLLHDHSEVFNSYSTGFVTGDECVGGLIGSKYTSGKVFNSYSTGFVTGNTDVGGLVGCKHGFGLINQSYWNTETSGQLISDGGEGRTIAEMTYLFATNTYVGWDSDVWELTPGSDNYPHLQWE